MPFAAVKVQPHLFRAALYEYLLGPISERVTPHAQPAPAGLLPTYRNAPQQPAAPQPQGTYSRYPRVGASPALFDVEMSHTEEPADLADHQGRVILTNILSSTENGFGRVGEYRMRATIYSTHDADASALMAHVAGLIAGMGGKDLPMVGQCLDSVADINRAGPDYQSGSGLWRGSVDFKVKISVKQQKAATN